MNEVVRQTDFHDQSAPQHPNAFSDSIAGYQPSHGIDTPKRAVQSVMADPRTELEGRPQWSGKSVLPPSTDGDTERRSAGHRQARDDLRRYERRNSELRTPLESHGPVGRVQTNHHRSETPPAPNPGREASFVIGGFESVHPELHRYTDAVTEPDPGDYKLSI
jgi:hypothetical protein